MTTLTKLEQETIILFNEAEQTATVDTCNNALIRQLDNLSQKLSGVAEAKADERGKVYITLSRG